MHQPVYLLFFTIIYYLLAFVFRAYLFWRETGLWPIAKSSEDDAHRFNLLLFKWISTGQLLLVLGIAFQDDFISFLLPIWYLDQPILQVIGWILLHLSLVLVCLAQWQMKDAWRIGIDASRKTTLVKNGLFSISRNPIYLGILLANLGMFLVLPTALTLLIGSVSLVSVQIQVRLEETFLVKLHGDAFITYQQSVNRWI